MLRDAINTLAEGYNGHFNGTGKLPDPKDVCRQLAALVQLIDQLRANGPVPLGIDRGEIVMAALLHEDLSDLAGWFSRAARDGVPIVMDREALAVMALAIGNMSARAIAMERLLGLKSSRPSADTAGGVVPLASRRTIDQLLLQAGWQPCDPPHGGAAA